MAISLRLISAVKEPIASFDQAGKTVASAWFLEDLEESLKLIVKTNSCRDEF